MTCKKILKITCHLSCSADHPFVGNVNTFRYWGFSLCKQTEYHAVFASLPYLWSYGWAFQNYSVKSKSNPEYQILFWLLLQCMPPENYFEKVFYSTIKEANTTHIL